MNFVTSLGVDGSTRPGRPWAEGAVWGALYLLSTGDSPGWLADHQPSRIRRRLGALRPGGLLWAARKRAEIHRFRASRVVLDGLRRHILISGADAGHNEPSHLEGYVTPEQHAWIRSDFPVVPDDDARDLTLRVSRFAAHIDADRMPIAFAAADMAGSDAASEAKAGLLVLDDLLRDFNGDPRDWLAVPEIAQVLPGELERGDDVFALRMLAKALSDSRDLTETADLVRFFEQPATTGAERWDILLAAVTARECRLRGIDPPGWTHTSALEPWWFPALVDDTLIPLTIQRTPPELACKGIWLDERALTAA
jgi:hypothetical protein